MSQARPTRSRRTRPEDAKRLTHCTDTPVRSAALEADKPTGTTLPERVSLTKQAASPDASAKAAKTAGAHNGNARPLRRVTVKSLTRQPATAYATSGASSMLLTSRIRYCPGGRASINGTAGKVNFHA